MRWLKLTASRGTGKYLSRSPFNQRSSRGTIQFLFAKELTQTTSSESTSRLSEPLRSLLKKSSYIAELLPLVSVPDGPGNCATLMADEFMCLNLSARYASDPFVSPSFSHRRV